MSEQKTSDPGDVITETVTLRYDYALGEVAGRFMAGLKEGKILATWEESRRLALHADRIGIDVLGRWPAR